MSSIHDILADIQVKMVAPKDSYNSFGKYKYRNVDSILQALKPFLKVNNCTIVMTDKIEFAEGRVYVQATVTLSNGTDSISSTALARESLSKKGMDESQITGTASSYARKYALSGLFAIDGSDDADALNNTATYNEPAPMPVSLSDERFKAALGAVEAGSYDINLLLDETKFALTSEQKQALSEHTSAA